MYLMFASGVGGLLSSSQGKALDKKQYVVEQGGNAVRELVKFKHYDENNPSNHNIALKYKKGDVAQVFNGNKFVDTPIEELLNYLILTAQDEITAILQLPDIKVTYVKQRYINKLQLNIKENKPETISMLKEELRNLMYENYDLVMKTYKKLLVDLNKTHDIQSNNFQLINGNIKLDDQ